MLKKSKLLVSCIIAMLLFTTLCFATDVNDNTENSITTMSADGETSVETPIEPRSEEDAISNEGEDSNENSEEATDGEDSTEGEDSVSADDIYNDNLTMIATDVKMDKLVDGNVYLVGSNVEITGQVNGNLFVFGNNVTFSDSSYIVNSVYVFANTVKYEGICSDLHVFANKLDIPYSEQTCFVFRDLSVYATSFNFAGGVGRNAHVVSPDFTFSTAENEAGIVYGNLNYSSSNELELSEEFVEGEVQYSKLNAETNTMSTKDIIISKLLSLGTAILYVVVIYLLALVVAPGFAKKSDAKLKSILPAFGIGLLSVIVVLILFIALLYTVMGAGLAFMFVGIYIFAIAIASSILSIHIANSLKEKIKATSKVKFVLLLLAITIILWLLKQIPYVGAIVSFIILMSGSGLFFMNLVKLPTKEKVETKSEN